MLIEKDHLGDWSPAKDCCLRLTFLEPVPCCRLVSPSQDSNHSDDLFQSRNKSRCNYFNFGMALLFAHWRSFPSKNQAPLKNKIQVKFSIQRLVEPKHNKTNCHKQCRPYFKALMHEHVLMFAPCEMILQSFIVLIKN